MPLLQAAQELCQTEELKPKPRKALGDLRRIAESAPPYLKPGGYLLMEHGFQQAAEVRKQLHEAGFAEVRSGRDYGGHERYTLGQWRGESA